MSDGKGTATKGGLVRRLAHKALMPVVAAAASAAAGYAAKRGPQLFEERVLPKLKQAAGGATSVAQDAPARVKSMAQEAPARVKSAAQDAPARAKSAVSSNNDLSQADLDRHVKRRAEARAARRKATAKA